MILKIIKRIRGFVKDNKIEILDYHREKNNIVWNILASSIYSAQSPVLLLIITRVMGLYEAGIFSVTYTLAHMFTNVGLYNMRSYQVSDTMEEYSFSDYYSSRIITVLLMIVSGVVTSIFWGYDSYKIKLALLWLIYRSIESIEDVYHGEVQKRGRLDIVSKIVFVRTAISTFLFCIILCIYKNLVWSTFILLISSVIIYTISNNYLKRNYDLKVVKQYIKIRRLLCTCFPVFISSFLYSYFVNAPKYAIDYYLTPESQSIFTIIFLPNMIINMLAIFIFKPMIVKMSEMWNQDLIEKFSVLILKQTMFLFVGTGGIALAGTWIGLPLLEIVYGVYLKNYTSIFLLLLLFGGISALNNYYTIVITVMRKQRYLLFAYGIGITVCLIITNYAVRRYKITGAAWSYGIVMLSMCMVLSIVVKIGIKEKRYISKDGNK